MGRRSLEATKLRCIWWARAVVTFLRACVEWAAAVFFAVELVDLCVVVDDVDFFLGGVVLSCARIPPPCKTIRQARMWTRKRLRGFTSFSVARLFLSDHSKSLTDSIPGHD